MTPWLTAAPSEGGVHRQLVRKLRGNITNIRTSDHLPPAHRILVILDITRAMKVLQCTFYCMFVRILISLMSKVFRKLHLCCRCAADVHRARPWKQNHISVVLNVNDCWHHLSNWKQREDPETHVVHTYTAALGLSEYLTIEKLLKKTPAHKHKRAWSHAAAGDAWWEPLCVRRTKVHTAPHPSGLYQGRESLIQQLPPFTFSVAALLSYCFSDPQARKQPRHLAR